MSAAAAAPGPSYRTGDDIMANNMGDVLQSLLEDREVSICPVAGLNEDVRHRRLYAHMAFKLQQDVGVMKGRLRRVSRELRAARLAARQAELVNETSRQALLCSLQHNGNRLQAAEDESLRMTAAAATAQALLAAERERRVEADKARLAAVAARQRGEGITAQLQQTVADQQAHIMQLQHNNNLLLQALLSGQELRLPTAANGRAGRNSTTAAVAPLAAAGAAAHMQAGAAEAAQAPAGAEAEAGGGLEPAASALAVLHPAVANPEGLLQPEAQLQPAHPVLPSAGLHGQGMMPMMLPQQPHLPGLMNMLPLQPPAGPGQQPVQQQQ